MAGTGDSSVGFDLMHIITVLAAAAVAWVFKMVQNLRERVAIVENNNIHHRVDFDKLEKVVGSMDSKMDTMADTLNEIRHSMPKRKTEQ